MNNEYTVFVYGTLLYPETRTAVIGRNPITYSDTLKGYKKSGLNIIQDEDSEVSGAWFEVSKEELASLDRYEGVSSNLYRRIEVELVSGDRAWVYEKCNPEQVVFGLGASG